jgi:hypothetical protein
MDQTVLDTPTTMLTTISPELVLTSKPQDKVKNAKLVTGSLSTGPPLSRMEESFLIPELNSEEIQRPSPSVPTKFSHAGTSLFHNSSKELKPLFTAHPTTLGEVPSPGPQLEESQSHFTQMLISISMLFNATEPLPGLSTSSSQSPPPCNQTDACGFTLRSLITLETIWS